MANATDIEKLLMCPLCKVDLTDYLKCPICKHQYSIERDIYIMLHPDLDENEWKWDEKVLSRDVNGLIAENRSHLNDDTIKAQKLLSEKFNEYSESFHGIVVDMATGLGGLLMEILKASGNYIPIATDVDPNILIVTSNRLEKAGLKGFAKVATNAKHMAFRDNSIDFITTLSGFGNIPDGFSAIEETYRTLKKGGKLVAALPFVDKGSESADFAKELGVERALVREYLVEDLKKVGFKNIHAEIVSSAVWAENPMDALPVTGDMQHFAIVHAEK